MKNYVLTKIAPVALGLGILVGCNAPVGDDVYDAVSKAAVRPDSTGGIDVVSMIQAAEKVEQDVDYGIDRAFADSGVVLPQASYVDGKVRVEEGTDEHIDTLVRAVRTKMISEETLIDTTDRVTAAYIFENAGHGDAAAALYATEAVRYAAQGNMTEAADFAHMAENVAESEGLKDGYKNLVRIYDPESQIGPANTRDGEAVVGSVKRGIQSAAEKAGEIGGSLKERLPESVDGVRDSAKKFGNSIQDWWNEDPGNK